MRPTRQYPPIFLPKHPSLCTLFSIQNLPIRKQCRLYFFAHRWKKTIPMMIPVFEPFHFGSMSVRCCSSSSDTGDANVLTLFRYRRWLTRDLSLKKKKTPALSLVQQSLSHICLYHSICLSVCLLSPLFCVSPPVFSLARHTSSSPPDPA